MQIPVFFQQGYGHLQKQLRFAHIVLWKASN